MMVNGYKYLRSLSFGGRRDNQVRLRDGVLQYIMLSQGMKQDIFGNSFGLHIDYSRFA